MRVFLPELDEFMMAVFEISTYSIPLMLKIISIVLLIKTLSFIMQRIPGEVTENNPSFYSYPG